MFLAFESLPAFVSLLHLPFGALNNHPLTQLESVDDMAAEDPRSPILLDVLLQQPVPELPTRRCLFDEPRVEGFGELGADLGREVDANLARAAGHTALVPISRRSSSSCSPSSSSCARSALMTSHTGLNADCPGHFGVGLGIDEYRDDDGADFFSSDLRIARPTACTMSTSERRGSMKPPRRASARPPLGQAAGVGSSLLPVAESAQLLEAPSRSPAVISPDV